MDHHICARTILGHQWEERHQDISGRRDTATRRTVKPLPNWLPAKDFCLRTRSQIDGPQTTIFFYLVKRLFFFFKKGYISESNVAECILSICQARYHSAIFFYPFNFLLLFYLLEPNRSLDLSPYIYLL